LPIVTYQIDLQHEGSELGFFGINRGKEAKQIMRGQHALAVAGGAALAFAGAWWCKEFAKLLLLRNHQRPIRVLITGAAGALLYSARYCLRA